MYTSGQSNVSCADNSTVTFSRNIAQRFAGAIFSTENAKILIENVSNVVFTDTIASGNGAQLRTCSRIVCKYDHTIICK